jgi:hypothetical protein
MRVLGFSTREPKLSQSFNIDREIALPSFEVNTRRETAMQHVVPNLHVILAQHRITETQMENLYGYFLHRLQKVNIGLHDSELLRTAIIETFNHYSEGMLHPDFVRHVIVNERTRMLIIRYFFMRLRGLAYRKLIR